MEAKELLNLARKYQKSHHWQKAINTYEQYINDNQNCDTKTYVNYAKCLRVVGQTKQAETVLMDGRKKHPESERILIGLFILYDVLGNWEAAKSTVETLITMNPKQANHYFRMGRIYAFQSDYVNAKDFFKTGLEYRHHLSFNNIMEKIQLGFTDQPTSVTSKYIFTQGRNNLGAFLHHYKGKSYFTKISRNTRDARREVDFYKDICNRFPVLKQTVPIYIDSQVIDKIIYLTIEFIDDIPTKEQYVQNIINSSHKISTIRYNDLIQTNPNPNYLFQLRNRAVSIVIFFTQIHSKYHNEMLFTSFNRLALENQYPRKAICIIKELEDLVMHNQLYTFINPEKHYALLQGDLISDNIKIHKKDETPIILDWGTYTIGPHFIDIARYLTSTFTTYAEIKKDYLTNEQTGGKLTLTERIFFLYATILFYFLSINDRTIEERLANYIKPAFEDMKILVAKLHDDELAETVLTLTAINKENNQNIKNMSTKIDDLEGEILSLERKTSVLDANSTKLKRDKKAIQKKYNEILNSKSWIITAPLRKLMSKFNKN